MSCTIIFLVGCGRDSFLGIFVNPIMQKAAAMVIFE